MGSGVTVGLAVAVGIAVGSSVGTEVGTNVGSAVGSIVACPDVGRGSGVDVSTGVGSGVGEGSWAKTNKGVAKELNSKEIEARETKNLFKKFLLIKISGAVKRVIHPTIGKCNS